MTNADDPGLTSSVGLQHLPRGTGYAVGITTQGTQTELLLSYPGQFTETVYLSCLPDTGQWRRLLDRRLRPMAVAVELVSSRATCSVLVAGTPGPRRMSISLAGALALCRHGVHTTVRSDHG